MPETHTIDATNKAVGRLAVEIATLLRGKHKPDFVAHQDRGDNVVVEHAEKMRFTGSKLEQKNYYHHSGYLGGLKTVPMKKVFEKDPGEVLRRAVYGMLPKNRLRALYMKRLKITTSSAKKEGK